MDLLSWFWMCVNVSLLSFGGTAALPLLHDELGRQRNLLPDSDFASAIAIGYIAPGPNGLFVLPIGYFLDGLPGAVVAALALWVVSMPVLLLLKIHSRLARYASVNDGMRGIEAGAIGLTLSVAYSIILSTSPTPFHLAIAAVAFVAVAFTRTDALVVLAGGGAIGLAAMLSGH